jgi:CheY-like chemotaxis protein
VPGERTILVVDDDDGMVALLSHLVELEGFRAETAADGVEASRKAHALKPDLIVLDLMLPRYGGFELLRDLQKTELAQVPIVVVTGRYTDGATMDMIRREANVVALLEKPINHEVFGQALRRGLKLSDEGEAK